MGRGAIAFAALALVAGCSNGSAPVGAPATTSPSPSRGPYYREYAVPAGSFPHDVAVAPGGAVVWYTAQHTGKLGRLEPSTGQVTEVALGAGSRPHGVIIGPDRAPWVTDTGLNALVRVDPETLAVRVYRVDRPGIGMHTAAVGKDGTIWFTGNAGWYGRLVPATGRTDVYAAPEGSGPYGITVTADGTVWFASLAKHYVARVDPATGRATVLRPPTANQGSRRVWADSRGRVWSSQWDAGKVAVYDPGPGTWREWRLPGRDPHAYAIYVDEDDAVWLSDFGANALVNFDPVTEKFESYPLPSKPGDVRQLHGRRGQVWGAESAADKIVMLRWIVERA